MALAGLFVAGGFAVAQGWSLQEFSWSTWVAGLVYTWACVVTGGIQAIFTARDRKGIYEDRLPFLEGVPKWAFLVVVVVVVIPLGAVALYLYTFLFGLYGLLLSFFAEMEPHSLFGRNGFINSDFFTPVTFLLLSFWPMVAGTLIANQEDLVRGDPWRRMALPASTEMIRIHVLVVAMPFLAFLTWALLGDRYHGVAVALLMGIFYLLPKKPPGKGDADRTGSGQDPDSDPTP
jgi:hypothetical protein